MLKWHWVVLREWTSFPGGSVVKNLPADICQCQRHRLLILPFIHIPNIMFWRRQWQPTPVLLTEKSHGPFIHITNIMFKICQNNSRTDFIFHSMCLIYTSLSLRDVCCCCYVASVVSDSVRPHSWQPTRLPCPWDSPGENTEVGCHFLLQCVKVKSESEVT